MKQKILFIALLILLALASPTAAQEKLIFSAIIISDSANLRAAPNTKAKIIRTLKKNTAITTASKESKNGWYQISVDKITGWLHGNTFEFITEYNYFMPPVDSEVPAGWYLIDKTTRETDAGYGYYYLASSVRKDNGRAEVWARIVPFNAQKYAKEYKLPKTFAYALEYVTLDCSDKRISIENLTLYTAKDKVLPFISFLSRTYRDPIIPGSIGESLWRKLCSK